MTRPELSEIVREVNPVHDPAAAVDPSVRTATLQRVLNAGGDSAPGSRWWRRRRLRLSLLGMLAPLVVAGPRLPPPRC